MSGIPSPQRRANARRGSKCVCACSPTPSLSSPHFPRTSRDALHSLWSDKSVANPHPALSAALWKQDCGNSGGINSRATLAHRCRLPPFCQRRVGSGGVWRPPQMLSGDPQLRAQLVELGPPVQAGMVGTSLCKNAEELHKSQRVAFLCCGQPAGSNPPSQLNISGMEFINANK